MNATTKKPIKLKPPSRYAQLIEKIFFSGGPLSIIAAIEQPEAIHKILTHLKLPPRAPPRAPARYDPWAQADLYTTSATYRSATH